MDVLSYISSADTNYVEALYTDYKQNPETVEETWRNFFEGFEFALKRDGQGEVSSDQLTKELRVYKLIQSYRSRAHLISNTNPIRERKDRKPHLELEYHGLSQEDLKQEFIIGQELNIGKASLQKIIERLQEVYTSTIGMEYSHIKDSDVRNWIRDKFESDCMDFNLPIETKKRILTKLNEAVVFENFLHTKYVGQKRFSLEGGENSITALDTIINQSVDNGVEEVVIGMAHRGRLNVLANILGKTYEYIFSEFEGGDEPDGSNGDGDVKYHLGFSSTINTPNGKEVVLKLTPNPSHLEAVDPVVQGYSRGKSDILYKEDLSKVVPVLIHGDAALAGQGVAYEVIQMSGLDGYYNEGTIHFVINNQLGFTTDFEEARSSDYSTDLAKVVDAPVLHVNGDDAEAVYYAAEFAVEYRQQFKRDIFIDLLCYRKHGHNEGDDPKITQPKFYQQIAEHPDPREVYSQTLVEQGDIEAKMAKDMRKEFKKLLQDRLNMVREKPLSYGYQEPDLQWKQLRYPKDEDFKASPDTSVKHATLEKVKNALTTIPDDFSPIRQISRELEKRQKSWDDSTFDWAMGELSAYGTMLLEGNNVRLSGQDSVRGTFAHRNAVIFDQNDNSSYNSLNHIQKEQANLRIYNSLLSENAALGFEYGYSLASPNTLTIWEAQFGDFNNGAQTVIDQFIVSGLSKWQKMSGLVLLLPHGYEGQGPEHSNARPERFLQLAAENNIIVANLTTPANFFHILRRQVLADFRIPLVVFTPKSLLRHPKCVSSIEEFTNNKLNEVIDDAFAYKDTKRVKRVLLCSGKVYYDLVERQEAESRKDIAIVRLEQLYPLPLEQLESIFNKYKSAEFCWVQEEPKNMGAWTYLLRWQENAKRLRLIARKASASPATGYHEVHAREQNEIIEEAFNLDQ